MSFPPSTSPITSSVSVVVQGALCERSLKIVERFREALPGCEIIVSTWSEDPAVRAAADVFIVSKDPGGFPVTHKGETLRVENLNRQIVSTAAGLQRASRPFSLKWRSDFDFSADRMARFVSRYLALLMSSHVPERFVACTVNTANPYERGGLVGHVSDWFFLARTESLRRFVASDPVECSLSNTEVVGPLRPALFPYGKFTCEQWFIRNGLLSFFSLGLQRADDVGQRAAFLRIIGRHLMLASPASVGLVTYKYDSFCYLRLFSWRSFLAMRLATIGAFEAWLLGRRKLRCLGVALLRINAVVLRVVRVLTSLARAP